MTLEASLAAWQPAPGVPLRTGAVTPPLPGAGELLVRNAAIAINPVDWILQERAIFPWLDYPAILGSDVAGEVVAVGPSVEGFAVGDRVLGQSVGATTNRPAHGAFQHHTILLENMACRIPPELPFVDAAVVPLGFGTAACGLFQKDHLGLAYPSLAPRPSGKVVLVWGGSSSVGCNAIQLAIAAGHDCVTTASPRNFELLARLGATVLDHADHDGLLRTLGGRELAGTLHATGSMPDCFAVVGQCRGRHFVSTTLEAPANLPAGIETRQIFGTSLRDNEVGRIVYREYLGRALATGKFRPAPPPRIVAHGLEGLQAALDAHRAGVSAAKLVVTL